MEISQEGSPCSLSSAAVVLVFTVCYLLDREHLLSQLGDKATPHDMIIATLDLTTSVPRLSGHLLSKQLPIRTQIKFT